MSGRAVSNLWDAPACSEVTGVRSRAGAVPTAGAVPLAGAAVPPAGALALLPAPPVARGAAQAARPAAASADSEPSARRRLIRGTRRSVSPDIAFSPTPRVRPATRGADALRAL